MNIGEAARISGISAKMIRHYEEIGLIVPHHRTSAGYRQYAEQDIANLRFIRHARDLGFSMKQIADLLSLWRNTRRSSQKVKRLAQQHLQDLDRKIVELNAMRGALAHLVHCCQGDDRPECPILEGLSGNEARE